MQDVKMSYETDFASVFLLYQEKLKVRRIIEDFLYFRFGHLMQRIVFTENFRLVDPFCK
jgi:hypothetical protein